MRKPPGRRTAGSSKGSSRALARKGRTAARCVWSEDGTLYLLTNNRDGRGTPLDKDDRIIQLAAKQL
ncbi:hypothetical protein ABHN11_01510 [Brevibacillus centrosporus]|uniref:hypothetical protein n=1 Tax=Brevibacillus centrosporus TaxID=54910 RepID=UPI0011450DAC|nr:hypothetical protein [Brevibacillus centrosporus]